MELYPSRLSSVNTSSKLLIALFIRFYLLYTSFYEHAYKMFCLRCILTSLDSSPPLKSTVITLLLPLVLFVPPNFLDTSSHARAAATSEAKPHFAGGEDPCAEWPPILGLNDRQNLAADSHIKSSNWAQDHHLSTLSHLSQTPQPSISRREFELILWDFCEHSYAYKIHSQSKSSRKTNCTVRQPFPSTSTSQDGHPRRAHEEA